MKIITHRQALSRMVKYLELMVSIPKSLPKTEREIHSAEYRLLAVLNTNYQDEYVDDWILSLIEDIKSKL
ncbi:hypothetical protein UES1_278 [Escherichia phage UE-S1]|nr:hypothetical protein UES1_278 [Escherichia phage UE-S1]